MILQEVLDILQAAANAGFAQTEVLLSIDNTRHEELKSVDLIYKRDVNKFDFSTGETLFEKEDILSLRFETKKEEKITVVD